MDDQMYIMAKKFERAGNWEAARKIWQYAGRKEDVAAIDMILEATRLGDDYRRLTEGLVESWERREINNAQLHQKLTEAWDKVYKW